MVPITGNAGALPGEAHGDEHRALARFLSPFVRLKIWGKLDSTADAPASDTAVDGDLALLYRNEAPRMRRWLSARFTPDRAADFVQASFVRMLRLGADKLEAIEHPRAYLYRAAQNLATDHLRSGEHRLEHQSGEDLSGASDPHGALEARDLLRRIEAAIPKLPDRTREIFMAHRFEHLTYQQIADRLGITIKVVEYHIALAMRELHRAVSDRP